MVILAFLCVVESPKTSLCISVHHPLSTYEILCQYLARFKSYRGGRADAKNPKMVILAFLCVVESLKTSLCISVHHPLSIYEILCQYPARFKSYRVGRADAQNPKIVILTFFMRSRFTKN